jgi:hypothetical protein
MEIKVWDSSFSKEDIEVILGVGLSEGEWEIVVDELYNNDELYATVQKAVAKVARAALE